MPALALLGQQAAVAPPRARQEEQHTTESLAALALEASPAFESASVTEPRA